MNIATLKALWATFRSQVRNPPPEPSYKVDPSLKYLGLYSLSGLVSLRPTAGDHVAIHEFAHHYDLKLALERTEVGAAFMTATGAASWDYESFAATVMWVLTGRYSSIAAKFEQSRALRPIFRNGAWRRHRLRQVVRLGRPKKPKDDLSPCGFMVDSEYEIK